MTNKNEKYTYLGLNVKHEIGGNESVNGNEIELADLSTKRNGEFGIGIKELNGLTSEKLNTIGGVEEVVACKTPGQRRKPARVASRHRSRRASTHFGQIPQRCTDS